MTFKFIHAADLHIDSPLHGLERYEGAPVDEIRGATRRAFNSLVDLAISESVEFILLAGDLYDGDWKDYNTGLYFIEKMGRLRDVGIKVFIIAGNHDAASQISKQLRLPDNVKYFSTSKPEKEIIEALDVAIFGQGFATRAVTEDISQAYPQGDSHLFNIGLLHTCLDGKPGHEPYAPCTVDGLRSKGYQYWALGHIHQREVISEEPWIIFPGNIQGRHIRELGNKGCSIVTVENGEVHSVEHYDLDVLRWARCTVSAEDSETVDDVYEKARHELQNTLDLSGGRPVAARLCIDGSTRAHARLCAEAEHWIQEFRGLATGLGGAGIWLEKVLLETTRRISDEALLDRDDAFGGLLRAIRDAELDDDGSNELFREAALLRQKLPPELLTGEDSFNLEDPEQFKERLDDVKELLVSRLLLTEQS